jgi:hypothetical protein
MIINLSSMKKQLKFQTQAKLLSHRATQLNFWAAFLASERKRNEGLSAGKVPSYKQIARVELDYFPHSTGEWSERRRRLIIMLACSGTEENRVCVHTTCSSWHTVPNIAAINLWRPGVAYIINNLRRRYSERALLAAEIIRYTYAAFERTSCWPL